MVLGGLVGAMPRMLLAALPWIRPALLPLGAMGGGVLLIIEFLGELPTKTPPAPRCSTTAARAQGRTSDSPQPVAQQEEKVAHAPARACMAASCGAPAMPSLAACASKPRLYWVDKIKPWLNQCKSNVHAFFSSLSGAGTGGGWIPRGTELFAPLPASIVFGAPIALVSSMFHGIRSVGQGFKIEKERRKFYATTGGYLMTALIFAMLCQMVVWYAPLDVAAPATRAPQYAPANQISKDAPFSGSDGENDRPHTQEDVSHDETPTQVRDEGVPQKAELDASNPNTQKRHFENGGHNVNGPQWTKTNTPKPSENSGAVHKDHTSASARKASGTKDSGTRTPIPSEDLEVEPAVWQK